MPTIALLNQSGEKVRELNLSDEIFGIEPNQQVIYDVVNCQRAAMRQGTHDTKGRSEVRGGGKKPWRQKGTGRARIGSIRAPQWRGGGTVFGPTPRSYAFKLNKKVKKLGLKNTLSYKVKENALIAVDAIKFEEIKTMLQNWHVEIVNSFTIINGRRISNGPIEGVNNKIRTLTKNANGYVNFERMGNRIMYVSNKNTFCSLTATYESNKKIGKSRGSYKASK